jgi:hypothetical protein
LPKNEDIRKLGKLYVSNKIRESKNVFGPDENLGGYTYFKITPK